jgi:hypothetical protein
MSGSCGVGELAWHFVEQAEKILGGLVRQFISRETPNIS